MGFKKFVKKAFKGVKKIAKVAAPIAAAYYGGPLASSAWGAMTGGATTSPVSSGGPSDVQDLGPLGTPGPTRFAPQSPGMWDFAGNVLAAGSSLAGGMMANQANAKQAQNQMDFQQDMSNTSYQRATKDMMEAGLNPMLAYSQGGASTPSGASSNMEDVVTPAINSGRQSALVKAQLQQMELQNQNTAMQTRLLDSQAQKTSTETSNLLLFPDTNKADIGQKNSSARAADQSTRVQELEEKLRLGTLQAEIARMGAASEMELRDAKYGPILSKFFPANSSAATSAKSEYESQTKAERERSKYWWETPTGRASTWEQFKRDNDARKGYANPRRGQ